MDRIENKNQNFDWESILPPGTSINPAHLEYRYLKLSIRAMSEFSLNSDRHRGREDGTLNPGKLTDCDGSVEDLSMEQTTTNLIEQRIHRFLMEKFPLARKARIDKDTALLEKGILDSLGILDVVSFLESEFSITIGDEELVPENFQNLNRLSTFVQDKQGKA